MVVDPTVKFLRMSEATAARLGLKGVGEGIPAEVVTEDGQKLPASVVVFQEVQVGEFTAKNVEGLVILKGSEARPVLGASFLERFTFRFDPDSSKLVLTRVELPPPQAPISSGDSIGRRRQAPRRRADRSSEA